MTKIIRRRDKQLTVRNFSDLTDGIKINHIVASIFGAEVFVYGLSATNDQMEK